LRLTDDRPGGCLDLGEPWAWGHGDPLNAVVGVPVAILAVAGYVMDLGELLRPRH